MDGQPVSQISSLINGLVRYVDRRGHRENAQFLANPTIHTFFKDLKYTGEAELQRQSLQAQRVRRYGK